jgi:hypothetical protein
MNWQGRYFDGRSAVRHRAIVELSLAAIHIRLEDGKTELWAYDTIRWTEPPTPSGFTRLSNTTNPDARLEIDDPDFPDALRHAYPEIERMAVKHRNSKKTVFTIAASCAAVVAILYAAGSLLPSAIAPLIPDSLTRSLGETVVKQVESLIELADGEKAAICKNPEGLAALNRLTRGLTPDDNFRVSVLSSPRVNALAAPGKQLVMFRGLIKFANGPDEFAAVLAHEIAHGIHRHPTEGMVRAIGLSAAFDLLFGGAGLSGTAISSVLKTAYSRDAERAADDTAYTLLSDAGFSTVGMVSLFERFEKDMPQLPKSLQIISTHPRSAERVARLKDRAQPGNPAMSPVDWQALQEICGKN